jgi:hypothetical protein
VGPQSLRPPSDTEQQQLLSRLPCTPHNPPNPPPPPPPNSATRAGEPGELRFRPAPPAASAVDELYGRGRVVEAFANGFWGYPAGQFGPRVAGARPAGAACGRGGAAATMPCSVPAGRVLCMAWLRALHGLAT